MCDCAEEQERKRREKQAAERHRLALEREAEVAAQVAAQVAAANAANAANREPPPPRFSMVQVAVGTTTCMLALIALLFTKVLDQDTAHSILSKVGLGQLVPKRVVITEEGGAGGIGGIGGTGGTTRPPCPVRLNPTKRRWPIEEETEEGKQ